MRLDDGAGADPVGKMRPSPASVTGTLQERRRLVSDMSAASTDLSLLNCLSLLHLSLRVASLHLLHTCNITTHYSVHF